MLAGCLVCVICDSSHFHSFIFKLIRYDFSHIGYVCSLYVLCTFDNMFGIVELRYYYVYTTFGVLTLLFVCNLQFKQISFLYIQTLHNDCSHIEDVQRGSRSRAEFGLVQLCRGGSVVSRG